MIFTSDESWIRWSQRQRVLSADETAKADRLAERYRRRMDWVRFEIECVSSERCTDEVVFPVYQLLIWAKSCPERQVSARRQIRDLLSQ